MEFLLAIPGFDAVVHGTSLMAASAGFMAASAVGTMISAVWEGAVLVACVALCLRLMPGLSAAARSFVWVSVFTLLVVLQILPYLGMHTANSGTQRPAPFQLGLFWCYSVAGVWLALSMFRGVQLAFSAIRLHRLTSRAIAVEPEAALRPLLEVQTIFGKVSRRAELCTSSEVERPSVFGFFRPRILVPPALMKRLKTVELQQVVLHEMEHLRRADDWTNLLQKLALVMFPLNPALLWVEHRLCAERELACDDRVLRSNCGRKAYAICLTHLAEYSLLRRSLSLALGAWERRPELVRRVHRMLRRPSKAMSPRQTLTMTGGLTAAVLGCALWLGHIPQLVGFTAPEQSAMGTIGEARVLPQVDGHAGIMASARQASESLGRETNHAQFVKAVMPGPGNPSQSAFAAPQVRSVSGARAKRTNAVLHSAKKHAASKPRQGWLVMTEWSATGTTTQRIVWAVQQSDQASYAAIRTVNGWLLIQI